MAKKTQKPIKYSKVIDALLEEEDDSIVCARYLEEGETVQTVEEFKKIFLRFANERNKDNTLVRRKIKNLEGINLSYFWSVLAETVFNILPANTNLNVRAILDDLEEVLEQNPTEASKAAVKKNDRTPTPFIKEVTEVICTKLLIERAISYVINDTDGI